MGNSQVRNILAPPNPKTVTPEAPAQNAPPPSDATTTEVAAAALVQSSSSSSSTQLKTVSEGDDPLGTTPGAPPVPPRPNQVSRTVSLTEIGSAFKNVYRYFKEDPRPLSEKELTCELFRVAAVVIAVVPTIFFFISGGAFTALCSMILVGLVAYEIFQVATNRLEAYKTDPTKTDFWKGITWAKETLFTQKIVEWWIQCGRRDIAPAT